MRRLLALGFSFLALACGGNTPSAAVAGSPEIPDAVAKKCDARAPDMRPVVVAWPSAEKGLLESRLTGKVVAVRYVGCEMRVVSRCTAPDQYRYAGFSLKKDRITATNADDLVAKIPIGAVSISGALAKRGAVDVSLVSVGRFEAPPKKYRFEDLDGACDDATHLVTGVTVGAYAFDGETAASLSAGAGAGSARIEGSSEASRGIKSNDGTEAACANAASHGPPANCGALLRLELEPLERSGPRCVPGLRWDGQGCVRDGRSSSSAVDCPDGMRFDGSKCIAKVSTACPSGTHFQTGVGCVPGAPSGDPTRTLVDDR